jgi:CheY-like chemotaxis protein
MPTSPKRAEILLAENDPQDLELFLRAFRRAGCVEKVFATKDGEEALAFAFASGAFASRMGRLPRVVFLAPRLARVDGWEVLYRLKKNDLTRLVPVVMLARAHDAGDMAHGYSLGANSFLLKPMDSVKFMETIAHAGRYWLGINQNP